MALVVASCLNGISDFLTDRFQFVCIDGFYSSNVRVISGVLQGSVYDQLYLLFS